LDQSRRFDARRNTVPKAASANEVAHLRDRIMDDLTPMMTFAAAIGKSKRSVQRMARIGQIEIVRLGVTPFVKISSARKAA
jgi:hypothetical protein